MKPRTSLFFFVSVVVASLAASGCKKPCDPIPPSAEAKSFGIVLDGGRLCRDENSVANVDYPDAKSGAVATLYKDSYTKQGWTATTPEDGIVFLTRDDKDTLFVVTGDRSKDRGVPFAVVRYCNDARCRSDLNELATVMAEKKK